MSATVQYRPDRGTWLVVEHRNGKRSTTSCKTEAIANARAKALNVRQAAGDAWLETGHESTATALRGWLDTHREGLSHGYEATARGLIEIHLIPHFGALPLAAITEGHLMAFVGKIYGSGKSGATALNALSLLRRVCQLHVDAGILAKNPAIRIGVLVARVGRRYEPVVKRADAWTRAEAATLLVLASTHEKALHGPLLCGLHTGMRRGEILGLEWSDVGASRIAVRRAWVRGRLVVPKSGKAREVPISGPLRSALAELRPAARQRLAWEANADRVFIAPNGLPWDEAKFGVAWRRLMARAVAAEVRPLRFHDTRHTFASWALDAGRSIRWVQERLGHSSAELTLRTYAHLMPDDGDEMGFLEAPGVRPAKEG
jgi:integrase